MNQFGNLFHLGRLMYLATMTRGLGAAYARTWTESGEPQDPVVARLRPLVPLDQGKFKGNIPQHG